MAANDIIKRPTNVHLTVSIQQLVKGQGKPAIAILTKGSTNKAKTYATIDDLTEDYPENTEVYANAKAAMEVPNFNETIEVIEYGSTYVPNSNTPVVQSDVTTGGDNSKPVDTSAPIVQAVGKHIFDGFYYITADNSVPESDLEALSDFLYDNQRVALYAQVKSISDLQKLSSHVQGYQSDSKEKQGNTGAIVETSDRHPAVQMIAYASINAPVDFGHIGNLTQFEPDADFTEDDYEAIDKANGSVIVNKADWDMSNSGKALAGNYVDQFVHVNMINDSIKYVIQQYMNSQKWPTYDENTVSMIVKLIDGVSKDYVSKGILNDPINVTSTPISQVPTKLKNERTFSKFGFDYEVASDVQNINANVNVIV
ncbi:hypothetical protein IV37_GL000186 [Fructilactobacillus fructivorans]|uniref:hypothetical protein n=1 Tax=Fructilactobacillus fructivorans TaxID=1614 RepID=UPI0007052B92|nr:hypothetical protein [Fructilactobacillus fructivorans]KRN13464.1 hypothetical protein IV37_GL000186 [Fructilactobacillus fructivorans]